MKKYLCIVCLLIAGCSTGRRLGKFEPNTAGLRYMDSVIAYNYNRPIPQIRIPMPIPQTQQDFQVYKKLGGYYKLQ